jgi:hypothetical protein
MTDKALTDKLDDIDEDYIDPPTQRADVSFTDSSPETDDGDTVVSGERQSSAGERQTYGDQQTTAGKTQTSDSKRQSAGERQAYDERSMDESFAIDRGMGCGGGTQLDDLKVQNGIVAHDGRANTNTYFKPSDAPSDDVGKFNRLIRWQEGQFDGRKQANRDADRRRWIETFCTALSMPSTDSDRVKQIVDDVGAGKMGVYGTEELILATISLVANEHARFIRDEDMFQQLVIDVETDPHAIKRCRQLIRQKTELI